MRATARMVVATSDMLFKIASKLNIGQYSFDDT